MNTIFSTTKFALVPAVYAVLRKEDKVLMMRRYNTGYMDGKYSFPAGHVEPNEGVAGAIVRELDEEIGVTVRKQDLQLVFSSSKPDSSVAGQERVLFFFEVTSWQGEPYNAEPDKCDDLQWFDIDNIPNNIADELPLFFQAYATGKRYDDAY
jgi:8-oxo-dGTP diphosphatase